SYMGAVNTKGRIEFSNKAWTAITPFSVNRAFAKDGQDRWWLINEKGAVVSETPFTKILYDSYYNDEELPFARGYAFVKANGGWCAIDPGGKVVITSSDLDDYSLTIRNGLLQLEKDVSTEDLGHPWKYGLWNTEAGKVIEPRYEAIYPVGEGNGLILAVENGLLTYIDPKGNQVWREQQPSDVLMPLNIDEMNRGYCYASSPYREDLAGFGGWGGSGNRSHAGAINERSNELAVFIDTSAKSTWQNKFSGLTMYVSNASCDTAFFAAQDSRLYLNLQAKDKQGQWRDIEYLPSSWCGNSYHQLFLGPAEHWKFVIPEYEGEFATLIRAKLRYQKTRGDREEVILFSNEIKGKINPGQFWNKSLYTPAGLMDPYLD
ncbi:MAG: repeat-containing protein, partial [Chitinophagaceae bacterium]|nr:repeat-containing protein [Chitinophagaceae bacterium]